METLQKIETRIGLAEERFIRPLLYSDALPLEVTMWEAPGEPVSAPQALAEEFSQVHEGAAWGPAWATAWFRFRGEIPEQWRNDEVVALIDLSFEDEEGFGREGQVWLDGEPVIALSRYRKAIPARYCGSAALMDFHVEASANPAAQWHWDNGERDASNARLFRLKEAKMARRHSEVAEFLLDFQVCRESMLELPLESTRRARLRHGLDAACRLMERGGREWILAASQLLAPLLASRNGDTTHQITAVGHAHIDTAWCWPLRETIRKCARTFSTALAYMEDHPDYKFSCSQPVQYLWMKAWYPTIYQKIRAAVKRGQWEPIGSMWVEPDCNVPSGESLVRQLIHGLAFFEEEFGVRTHDLWLPDVFGYSAALPQILRKAGVDRFLTQKISWNDTNKFPHHTFLWEGIDGTQIFSHFPPVDTYTARVESKELVRAERQFAHKESASRSLMPYGYGDGGGGPTVEMLGRIRRWENFEGMPRVEFGTVKGFFDAAIAEFPAPPVWRGELYLELHRGTFTSQAQNKWMNCRCETLLRDAEYFDALASRVAPGEALETDPWPKRTIWDVPGHISSKSNSLTAMALDRAWKLLLLNQFHDILPGSSIARVYQDSARDYQVIEHIALAVREASIARLMTVETNESHSSNRWTAFNSSAHARHEVAEIDGHAEWLEVPGCGQVVVSPGTKLPSSVAPVTLEKSSSGWVLANGLLRVEIAIDGTLVSMKAPATGRELLTGPGNQFQLLRDYPNRWSAWDIEAAAMEDFEVITGVAETAVLEPGGMRVRLEISRKFGKSRLVQQVILRAGSARLDFDTTIDWQERDRVLKVAFPLAMRSEHVICEIQSGHVRRTVHRNTSWDAARFEMPVQRWLDLGESDAGVAILNQGIYGCDVLGSRVRLTLLKGASAPDPEADLGIHRRVFSIFPHSGSPLEGGVIEEALALNRPLLTVRGQPLECVPKAWLEGVSSGITLEALKRAEDGDGLVMRWLNAAERHCEFQPTGLLAEHLVECDLLEREIPNLPPAPSISLGPFDLRTFRSR